MPKSIIEEMIYCKKCKKETLHRKTPKPISIFVHLFLVVITLGIWIPIWVILILLRAYKDFEITIGKQWLCSSCTVRT